jgi:hypothetical protein
VPCKRLLSGCLRETQGLIQILERDTAIGRARGSSVLALLGSGDQSMIRWVAGSTWCCCRRLADRWQLQIAKENGGMDLSRC